MSGFVWLASYPKSGNTWLRVFLANYLSTAEPPADINSLDSSFLAAARLPFDDLSGVTASTLTHDEIDRGRAEVMRIRARDPHAPRFVKVHDRFRYLADGTPLFPLDVIDGVIYVIRNPLDVAISFSHHSGRGLQGTIDDLCSATFAMAAAPDRLPEQLPQLIGSWSDHVRSWVDASGLPTAVFRYEDLLAEPTATFARLVSAAGLPFDAERLTEAIAHSRFDALRAQEDESGFRERPHRAERFFRSGRSGGWRSVLTAGQINQIVDAHGEMMERFGYLPITSPPASEPTAGAVRQP